MNRNITINKSKHYSLICKGSKYDQVLINRINCNYIKLKDYLFTKVI